MSICARSDLTLPSISQIWLLRHVTEEAPVGKKSGGERVPGFHILLAQALCQCSHFDIHTISTPSQRRKESATMIGRLPNTVMASVRASSSRTFATTAAVAAPVKSIPKPKGKPSLASLNMVGCSLLIGRTPN